MAQSKQDLFPSKTTTQIPLPHWPLLKPPLNRPNKRPIVGSPTSPHKQHIMSEQQQQQTATQAVNNAANAPAADVPKKDSFWEELKRKLFPNARGRDKPAEVANGAPAATEAAPAAYAAPAAAAATEGDAANAAAPAEKKSFIDKIKELFGKKKDAAAAPAANAEGQAAEAVNGGQAAVAQETAPVETVKEAVQEAKAEEPVASIVEQGEEAVNALKQ